MQDTPKGKKKKYKMSKRTARLIWLSIVFASIVSIFSGFSLLEQGYKTPGVLLILFLPGILVLGFAFYRSGFPSPSSRVRATPASVNLTWIFR